MSALKTTFAPLPARAIGDRRLTGLHLRALAAICLHDRMSTSRGKGQGCWASNKTLAEECGCHFTNLSTAITDLGRWGYVAREVHPLNKRLRVYRVIYSDADLAFAKASNRLPTDKQSTDTDAQTLCPETKDPTETVCPHFSDTEQIQLDAEVNIFRETGKISGETFERDSAEAAPLGSSAPMELSIGAQLARFERELKGGARADVGAILKWHDWLVELHDSLDINDPNSGRAYRLLEEIEWPDEVYAGPTERNLDRMSDGQDEAPDPNVSASGTDQGAMKDPSGEAPAPWAGTVLDEESSLGQVFPKLYDTFLPNEDHPWDPTPGDPDVLERLVHADRNQRAQASVLLKLKGPKAAAEWVRANLAPKASAA